MMAATLLTACGGDATGPAEQAAVTVTGAPVTHTAAPVTATAGAVTVTPPSATVPGPTATVTAPAVTVTAAGASDNRRGTPTDIDAGTAVEALSALPVKGRAPKTGYDREQFGSAWTDDVDVEGGRNGCDTRNDILRRDLGDLAVKAGTSGCVALTGYLDDPFTGERMPFVRGEDSASQIHIDHLVSLSNAWQTGAQQLSARERQNLANDPLNLWAVDGSANQQKGDGDAATWLPPNRAVRCDLVAHQVAVKARYGLWVTAPEAEAIQRVLSSCPGHPLPS